MVCKNCKRAIDADSIYCKWCGERQIRERKKKGEVKVEIEKAGGLYPAFRAGVKCLILTQFLGTASAIP